MSLPYGRRTSKVGAGPGPSGIQTSVASSMPSRIGTVMFFSTLKLIASPSWQPPPHRDPSGNRGQGRPRLQTRSGSFFRVLLGAMGLEKNGGGPGADHPVPPPPPAPPPRPRAHPPPEPHQPGPGPPAG